MPPRFRSLGISALPPRHAEPGRGHPPHACRRRRRGLVSRIDRPPPAPLPPPPPQQPRPWNARAAAAAVARHTATIQQPMQSRSAPPRGPRSVPPPLPRGHGVGGMGRTAIRSRPAKIRIRLSMTARSLPVTKDRFVIGRGKQSSDLTLKDPNVSRQHAMIEFQNGIVLHGRHGLDQRRRVQRTTDRAEANCRRRHLPHLRPRHRVHIHLTVSNARVGRGRRRPWKRLRCAFGVPRRM